MIDQPEAERAAVAALLREAASRAADWTSARLRFAIVGRQTIAEGIVERAGGAPAEFTPGPRTCATFEALALASVREHEGLWISLDATVEPGGRARFEENWRDPVIGISGDASLAPGLDDYAAFFAEFPRDAAFVPWWAPGCGQTTVRARIEAALDSHPPLERLDEGGLPMPLARERGLCELARDGAWREFVGLVRRELGRGIADALLVSSADPCGDALSLPVGAAGAGPGRELSSDDRARVRAALASVVDDSVAQARRLLARRHVFEAVRMARRALELHEADAPGRPGRRSPRAPCRWTSGSRRWATPPPPRPAGRRSRSSSRSARGWPGSSSRRASPCRSSARRSARRAARADGSGPPAAGP